MYFRINRPVSQNKPVLQGAVVGKKWAER